MNIFEQLKHERFSGKIVFVNPNTRSRGLSASDPPFSLMLLMGVCRDLYIPYSFIEADAHDLADSQVIDAINKAKCEYVGIPLFSPNIGKMFSLLTRIKKETNATLIVGGPAPSSDARWLMENCRAIDFAVIGEGEAALPTLLSAIEKRREIEAVPSIAYWNGDELVINPREKGYLKGDILPMPDFTTIDYKQYITGGFLPMGAWPSVHIYASRGCPFNCTFCANPVWQHAPNPVATSVVIEWIKTLEKQGVSEVVFADDTLNLNKKWFTELCEQIIAAKLNDKLIFRGLIRANLTDFEQLKLARRAGFWVFTIGVESGSEEVLRYYNKQETLDEMATAIELCRSAGIKSLATFIAGAPIDTAKTLLKTANFIRETRPSYSPVYLLHPIVGASVAEDIVARGWMTEHEVREYDNGYPTIRTETLDTKELIEIINFMISDFQTFRKSDFYRNIRKRELQAQDVNKDTISKILLYEKKENDYIENDNGIPNVRFLDKDFMNMSWLPDNIVLSSRDYRIKRNEWHEIEAELNMRWSRPLFSIPFYLKNRKKILEIHWASMRAEDVCIRIYIDETHLSDVLVDKSCHDWRIDEIALFPTIEGAVWVKFEVMNPFYAPNDPRELGMAIRSIRFV